MVRTLSWCYPSLAHLARDHNCPYSYDLLAKRLKKYGSLAAVWRMSLRENWREVDIKGWRVRLSPKHLKMLNEGTFETKCRRWFHWLKVQARRQSKRVPCLRCQNANT